MLSWQAILESGGCDLIITSHNVGLFGFEPLNVVSEGLIVLFLQVEKMVRLLLNHPV